MNTEQHYTHDMIHKHLLKNMTLYYNNDEHTT
jgi:hypothetical protein